MLKVINNILFLKKIHFNFILFIKGQYILSDFECSLYIGKVQPLKLTIHRDKWKPGDKWYAIDDIYQFQQMILALLKNMNNKAPITFDIKKLERAKSLVGIKKAFE